METVTPTPVDVHTTPIPSDDVTLALLTALRTEPSDATAAGVLLDRYQELGATPEQAAKWVRQGVGEGVSALDEAAMQARLTQARREHLERVIATAGRAVSRRYWARVELEYLNTRMGIVKVVIGADLRGTPDDGVVYVRPATRGRYGRPRKDKEGERLNPVQMRDRLVTRYTEGLSRA